jgi:DNA polymerase-3 subunit delta
VQLRLPDLETHLAKTLLPIYLVSGDEPLQTLEAADAVRRAARTRGHDAREILEADGKFNWDRLAGEAGNLSLFGDRRLLELRMPGGRPGAQGSAAIAEYAARPPEDAVLLVVAPKLERDQARSAWVRAVDDVGAVIQIWPVEADRLAAWVAQRMRQRGLQPGPGVAELLAERAEGNLLACVQEIEKLLLIKGPGPVARDEAADAVADSARYDVYRLVDCALEGDALRSLRMLRGLRAEGTAASVVLWALARELRTLASVAHALEHGTRPEQALQAQKVWDKRRALVQKAVKRGRARDWQALLAACARCDLAIKGQDVADPWLLLEDVTLVTAGTVPLRASGG